MARNVGPDPDERSPPPDPDRHYESRAEKRAGSRRRNAGWSCGWGLGPRLRAATLGVLPVVATRDRIKYHRVRHYGWKGQAVTAWNKLANHDKFATTPSRMDFVTDFPGTALRATFYGVMWNLLALLFITRYATGRAWGRLTLIVDGAEWLVCAAIGGVRRCGGLLRRGWNVTLGRVIADD